MLVEYDAKTQGQMHQARKIQNSNKIENRIKLGKVVLVGSKFHYFNLKEGLELAGRGADLPSVCIGRKQLFGDDRLVAFEKAILNGENLHPVLVLAQNLDDWGGYGFEKLACEIKQIEPKSIFALLTKDPQLVGHPRKVEDIVKSRSDSNLLKSVDYIFHYNDSPQLFITIISLIEDKMNYPFDHERVTLVVEDKPVQYTRFLTQLQEINKGRTRILLAQNYEEAAKVIDECPDRLAGAIIDVNFPKSGEHGEHAWKILSYIQEKRLKIPTIFKSADAKAIERVSQTGRVFAVHNEEWGYLHKIAKIMEQYFGFGSFAFRTPDPYPREVARVDTLEDMVALIRTVAGDVLINHAQHNHFSNWLWLHGYKELAERIKPIDTMDPEEGRALILEQVYQVYPHLKP